MIYLFLAILCSSSLALLFKYSESKEMNRYAITTVNYLAAFSISFVLSLRSGLFKPVPRSLQKFLEEFEPVILENQGTFSEFSSFFWGILVGVLAGVFFFLGFIYYQKSVKENGAGLSGMFGKLGILVPMIFSILLWREFPTKVQWIGIFLALISIVLANINLKRVSRLENIKFTLILLFLFMGMAEFSNKIFQKYGQNEYKSVFLFFVFLVAFLTSLWFTIKRRKKVTKKDIILGIMVGIPNLFSSFFLIMSLDYVKTSVAFPIFSAGGIVLITIGSAILFGERLKTKDIFAICLTIIALVLINL